MTNRHLKRAQEYMAGKFTPDPAQPDFEARAEQFHRCHDDWYRGYYARHGENVDAIKALVEANNAAFMATHGHLDMCYQNCAISSGENPHHDAVLYGHHTTDELDRVVGADWHVEKNILPASERALQRAAEISPLLPDFFFVSPPAFEGTTRVFSAHNGSTLTGGLTFKGADYMSNWNIIIDACKALTLDDPKKDLRDTDQIRKEIMMAQGWSKDARPRKQILTSDWGNSRNSLFEMYRANIKRFGLHPLYPEAEMKIWVKDYDSKTLSPATLLDCTVPAVQNVLRWTPQGIAAEEACRVVARLFNLHRLRTDPEWNAKQQVPLQLGKLDPLIANPHMSEIRQMDELIKKVEPFLLKYCPHLIPTEGLPDCYEKAKAAHPLQPKDIGRKSVKWQRANIPADEALELWEHTLSIFRGPEQFVRPETPPRERPPHRTHDIGGSPFDKKWNCTLTEDGIAGPKPIWDDNPYPRLSRMEQDALRMTVGSVETGLVPARSGGTYFGVIHDSKRGTIALKAANDTGSADLALLPGRLGRDFNRLVKIPNQEEARAELDKIRVWKPSEKSPDVHREAAFGSPVTGEISSILNEVWHRLPGPGSTPGSDFRLALNMKIMDRNMTVASFQDGWETSEDNARLMLRATLIELEKIPRPFEQQNAIYPRRYGRYRFEREEVLVAENREKTVDSLYISFFERYDKLRQRVYDLTNDPHIRQLVRDKDKGSEKEKEARMQALEDAGIRHTTVVVARMMEIYDCFIDPVHNARTKDFAFHKLRRPDLFKKDIEKIGETRDATMDLLLNKWVWMWNDSEFEGLRRDYRAAWEKAHGLQAAHAGPPASFDQGVTHRGNPKR